MSFKRIILRMYPTKEQEELFNKNCGCSRFIYNWGLGERIKAYKKGKKLSVYDLMKKVT